MDPSQVNSQCKNPGTLLCSSHVIFRAFSIMRHLLNKDLLNIILEEEKNEYLITDNYIRILLIFDNYMSHD